MRCTRPKLCLFVNRPKRGIHRRDAETRRKKNKTNCWESAEEAEVIGVTCRYSQCAARARSCGCSSTGLKGGFTADAEARRKKKQNQPLESAEEAEVTGVTCQHSRCAARARSCRCPSSGLKATNHRE